MWDLSHRHWGVMEGFRAGECYSQSCVKKINLAVCYRSGFFGGKEISQ